MDNKLKKFNEVCPRQLKDLPCESCPIALECINAIKSEGSDKKRRDIDPHVGCPWFVASAEHNYCFWVYDQILDGDAATDREICDLLLMSKSTLEKTVDSAISKLRELKDTAAIRDLVDSVSDVADQNHIDFTSYMPSEFKEAMDKTNSKDTAEDTKKDKPRNSKGNVKHLTGLPLHRDGKKTDLWGLYSRSKYKKPEKKNDTEKKDNKK